MHTKNRETPRFMENYTIENYLAKVDVVFLMPTTAQSDLQINCNPHQNSNNILHRTQKIYPKICMEAQKSSHSPSNLEQKEISWRHYIIQFQETLQSYSICNSMVQA